MDGFALRARGTGLGFVVLAHLVLGYALVTSLGTLSIVRPASELVVSLVPDRPRAQPPASAPLPLHAMQRPVMALPPMPEISIAPRETMAAAAPPAPLVVTSVAASSASAQTRAITVQPPRADMAYLSNPAPAYPPLSRRLREEGRVLLRVHVDARGEVIGIEVSDSSGHARLDEAALTAVRRWRFAPARAGDEPVAGWATVPVSFRLDAA